MVLGTARGVKWKAPGSRTQVPTRRKSGTHSAGFSRARNHTSLLRSRRRRVSVPVLISSRREGRARAAPELPGPWGGPGLPGGGEGWGAVGSRGCRGGARGGLALASPAVAPIVHRDDL